MAEPGPGGRAASRRELITRAGALLAAGALPALAGAARATAQEESGKLRLTAALGLERSLITTYRTAQRTRTLDAADRRLTGRLEAHALIHADELETALAPAAAPQPAPAPAEIPGLAEVRGARGYLELALGLESQLYLAYLDAVRAPLPAELVALAAEFGASVAQHLALLRERLGAEPAPSPFEAAAAA